MHNLDVVQKATSEMLTGASLAALYGAPAGVQPTAKPTLSNDPFADFAAPKAPTQPAAAAASDPFAAFQPSKPVGGPIAAKHGHDFDSWWESVGGSPKPSATAQRLTPSKSFVRSPSKRQVVGGAGAPVSSSSTATASLNFDHAAGDPFGHSSSTEPVSKDAFDVDFSSFTAQGSKQAPASKVDSARHDEWHVHDEEPDEVVDEDLEEFSHSWDTVPGQIPGARSKRASVPEGGRSRTTSTTTARTTSSDHITTAVASDRYHAPDVAVSDTLEGPLFIRGML
jgi:hypothetical protein